MGKGLWTSPLTVLIAAALTGVVLEIIHHVFYAYLNGRNVPTTSYTAIGSRFSGQQLNIAIGTLLAFFSKACFALAMSISYYQLFWRFAHSSTSGRKLSTLDSASEVLDNLGALFKDRLWLRNPALLLVAFAAWLMPLASLVTPATLSIDSVLRITSNQSTVPAIDFQSLDFALAMPVVNSPWYRYAGPSLALSRVAAAVGAQGEILPIPAPALNVTWQLDFQGPSLKCDIVEEQESGKIWQSVLDRLYHGKACIGEFGYLGWVPPTPNATAPFSKTPDGRADLPAQDLNAEGAFSLYVSAFNMSKSSTTQTACVLGLLANDTKMQPSEAKQQLRLEQLEEASVLRCQVHNASYVASFTYHNGQQRIDVSAEPFGPPMVPQITYNRDHLWDPDCSPEATTDCAPDVETLRLLAHQSITASFVQLLRGSVGFPSSVKENPDAEKELDANPSFQQLQSRVVQTTLVNTKEFLGIRTVTDDDTLTDPTRQTQALDPASNSSDKSLREEIERMFINFTMSLMSDPSFRWMDPSATANVTYMTSHNVYVYNPRILWAAYVTAIALTCLAIALGLYAIRGNGALYDSSFSTVFKASRAADVREPVPDHRKEETMVIFAPLKDYRQAGETAGKEVNRAYDPLIDADQHGGAQGHQSQKTGEEDGR